MMGISAPPLERGEHIRALLLHPFQVENRKIAAVIAPGAFGFVITDGELRVGRDMFPHDPVEDTIV